MGKEGLFKKIVEKKATYFVDLYFFSEHAIAFLEMYLMVHSFFYALLLIGKKELSRVGIFLQTS